jgi:hypothetical protein
LVKYSEGSKFDPQAHLGAKFLGALTIPNFISIRYGLRLEKRDSIIFILVYWQHYWIQTTKSNLCTVNCTILHKYSLCYKVKNICVKTNINPFPQTDFHSSFFIAYIFKYNFLELFLHSDAKGETQCKITTTACKYSSH